MTEQEVRNLCKPSVLFAGDATTAPPAFAKRIAEMRAAYRDYGTPFPGIPEKENTASAYRGTVVVAVGGNQTPFQRQFA